MQGQYVLDKRLYLFIYNEQIKNIKNNFILFYLTYTFPFQECVQLASAWRNIGKVLASGKRFRWLTSRLSPERIQGLKSCAFGRHI